MSVVKINRRENTFAQIDKTVLEDDSISWKAKGIISYLLSKPDGWKVRVADIVKHGPKDEKGQAKRGNGEEAIYEALRELRSVGYAKLVVERVKGVIVGKSWEIFEQKQQPKPDKPNRDNPDKAKPDQANTGNSNNDLRDNDYYTNNELSNSAEINSAIPETPFESKPKEKGTPGAEPWTKEIATLFDRVNKEESEAAGIDHVEFNWQANSGMNFGALSNIKKVLIADIKAKNNIPDDHTLKISFEHIFRCGFRLLLDNANGVGGLFSFTPMKIYKKYDDIKSFAHRGRQVKRTKSDLINEQRAKAIYEIATDDSEPGLFGY